MKPLLFPTRKRCRACRRYFGFEVILRMYCSHVCATLPESTFKADDLPRSCKVKKDGRWESKLAIPSPRIADRLAKQQKVYRYHCNGDTGCGSYHLSSKSAPYREVSNDGN